MAVRDQTEGPPTRMYASLEVGLAAIITCVGAALFVAMPNLLAEGGIPEAQDFTRLSPIFFPRLAFGLLTILGVTYLVFAIRQLASAQDGEMGEMKVDGGTVLRVLTVYGLALCYPLVMSYLGFIFSSCLLIGGITILLGKRVWWQVILFAILAPLTIRFVFERLLSISLPTASIEVLSNIEEAMMQLLVKIFFLH